LEHSGELEQPPHASIIIYNRIDKIIIMIKGYQ